MTPRGRYARALAFALAGSSVCATSFPPLGLIQKTMLTTAKQEFDGEDQLTAAVGWTAERLRGSQDTRAPHLACTDYGRRRDALSSLQKSLGPDAVRPVSSTKTHGACFIATASHKEAEAVMSKDGDENLVFNAFAPFPSVLKLAPGLLDHDCGSGGASGCSAGRLSTIHGVSMRMDSVHGLMVELSPGTFGESLMGDLIGSLNARDLDLHASNFWSDFALAGGEHLASAGGELRGREWRRAADVVHGLCVSGETSPSDICAWGDVEVHAAGDVLLVSGLDHLLHSGRGVGGESEEEAAELKTACFMGLLSVIANKHEVLRVATWNRKRTLNAAARANIQSATVTGTPLTDIGLDGSGEVIQIVDSGLNETSCYFEHGDGTEVTHGHYFEEVGTTNPSFSYSDSESFSKFKKVFEGGDFAYDLARRKVVQYIELIKNDGGAQEEEGVSSDGVLYPYIVSDEFSVDDGLGHGSHTAGTAAGSTLTKPADPVACTEPGEEMGCGGGCISGVASPKDIEDDDEGIDRLCPKFGCVGGVDDQQCLGDDVSQTLSEHGGMAQGAKISVFDIFMGDYSYGDLAGNGLWESCLSAGCKIHSNSYGIDKRCELSSLDIVYDDFMYQNQENLLIFAAGNEGWATDRGGLCTVNSPGIAKNVLAIGSTSSGQTRLTTTAMRTSDEQLVGADYRSGKDLADIDTISSFSSYGPTTDGRIKPEVLAPGDEIYSADGKDDGGASCRLTPRTGTSMSTAVASGAAALVRQYFADSSFYAADVEERGFCGDVFTCSSFSASAATVKAMLINSANLLGDSSEPSSYRGFGRIHLEAGMPYNGEGPMALLVKDQAEVRTDSFNSVYLSVDADAGLDLRATLSWIDPAASSISAVQLVNNLDLRVIAPNRKKFYMWADNPWDEVNVNERVIVSAEDVAANGGEGGTWEVRVRSRDLATDKQTYSLVVTGAISPPGSAAEVQSVDATDDGASSAAMSVTVGVSPFLLTAAASLAVLLLAAF